MGGHASSPTRWRVYYHPCGRLSELHLALVFAQSRQPACANRAFFECLLRVVTFATKLVLHR